jgi:dihydroneopterin aldolase
VGYVDVARWLDAEGLPPSAAGRVAPRPAFTAGSGFERRRGVAVIRIHDIPLEVLLGALPEERVSPQSVRLDLEIETNIAPAVESDRLDDAVNYIDVVEAVRLVAEERTYHLVETLARRVRDVVGDFAGVQSVTARVRKEHLPGMGDVGYVEVEDRG